MCDLNKALKNTVLRDVTPFSLVEMHRRFGGTCVILGSFIANVLVQFVDAANSAIFRCKFVTNLHYNRADQHAALEESICGHR